MIMSKDGKVCVLLIHLSAETPRHWCLDSREGGAI